MISVPALLPIFEQVRLLPTLCRNGVLVRSRPIYALESKSQGSRRGAAGAPAVYRIRPRRPYTAAVTYLLMMFSAAQYYMSHQAPAPYPVPIPGGAGEDCLQWAHPAAGRKAAAEAPCGHKQLHAMHWLLPPPPPFPWSGLPSLREAEAEYAAAAGNMMFGRLMIRRPEAHTASESSGASHATPRSQALALNHHCYNNHLPYVPTLGSM